jgi:hypothetical protein
MKTAPILAMLLLVSPALAHETKGPHGGQQVDAGAKHVELLTKGATVEVFVLDEDGKLVDAGGYKGVAILVVGGKPARIPLAPAGGDHLTGVAPAEMAEPVKGAVQITTPDGHILQGTFK